MSEAAVVVDHVSKRFRLYHERSPSLKAAVLGARRSRHDDFWALQDVSFEVPVGSTFGIVGRNGSGKSTLLKCLAEILEPDVGRIGYTGRLASLLEVGSGFHPELSGRENVYLNGSILGMPRRRIRERFDEIVDFAGVERFIDQPVKTYSSGMYVRLGFAVAINVDPDILVVDEVLAVGDAAFRKKSQAKFAEFAASGKTVIMVTHSMSAVREMCDRGALLDAGRLVMTGTGHEVVAAYQKATDNG